MDFTWWFDRKKLSLSRCFHPNLQINLEAKLMDGFCSFFFIISVFSLFFAELVDFTVNCLVMLTFSQKNNLTLSRLWPIKAIYGTNNVTCKNLTWHNENVTIIINYKLRWWSVDLFVFFWWNQLRSSFIISGSFFWSLWSHRFRRLLWVPANWPLDKEILRSCKFFF